MEIAEATTGMYVPFGASGEGLQTIYQQKLALIPKEDLAEKRHKVPLERFIWPLGAAIILLIVDFLMGGRKSQRSLRIPFVKTAGRRQKKVAAIATGEYEHELVDPDPKDTFEDEKKSSTVK